jgi:hypothetical protein
MAKCQKQRQSHNEKGDFNAPCCAFLIICCIKSTSLNPDANSSRVPQGSAAAAVTNAGGVAIDAHDADHRADVRGRSEPAPLQTADGCIPERSRFRRPGLLPRVRCALPTGARARTVRRSPPARWWRAPREGEEARGEEELNRGGAR